MQIDIISLFPKIFTGPLTESLLKRAQEKNIINIKIHNLRDYAQNKYRTVDDAPYGGGPGMIMKVDVFHRALQKVIESRSNTIKDKPYIILMTPQGKILSQNLAKKISRYNWLIIICGHFEGYDERIRSYVDAEISIGDYILTGGELPAMVLTDTVVRLIPGVVGKKLSLKEESLRLQTGGLKIKKLLEYPQYTRPEKYLNKKVPKILISGNHQAIANWRQEQALKRTQKRRPDLL